ncbi:MAG TPA: UDP-N-acetylglucosamine 2-epimerase (non-hydrolyzing) [Acidobacteriota bacterium]|nr:UDP-N-acetylglucosamine 2-epimerase (non-hydrolyzing) [Acidobacteriota bacterium]
MKKVLTIFGTRPEAIKLAPILIELGKCPDVQSRVCVTAQHRQMLDQVLGLFGITPDIDLDIMTPGQSLATITARVVEGVDKALEQEKPDVMLIQGDTTTVMASAMAAFYRKIAVGHVEAGLRSGNISSPFPEEMNRRIASLASHLHFAPTERAVQALRLEGLPNERIFLTGNTVIDALYTILARPIPEETKRLLDRAGISGNGDDPKLILVTAHRRENFGNRFESLCRGLKAVVERNRDVVIIYPVHLNPNVREPVYRILDRQERVILTKPVEYDVLSHLMKASYIVLTDSGGIQEEAPSLGKPVLVMRTETERPEGVEAGTAKLVGPFEDRIIEETEILLRSETAYASMAKAVNPYGDGRAAERIVDIIMRM